MGQFAHRRRRKNTGAGIMSRSKPDKNNFISWNEEMIQRYDPDEYHNHPSFVIRNVEKMRCRKVRAMFNESQDKSIVDLGCGAGNLIQYFDDFDYIGVDISEFILAKAARRAKENASLIRASVEELPFKDGSVSALFCSEVIEHVLDPSILIREAHRILTTGGTAVFTIPNEGLINKLKSLVPGAGGSSDGYNAPQRMDDEWHLTSFDARLFEELSGGLFSIEKKVAVPFSIIPLRYVFKLRKS